MQQLLDIRYKTILRVALPMMLSGFIQSVISITDAAFLSRYSELAYNASGSAGLWYITLFMIFVGLTDGAQIEMAQKIGEKDDKGVAAIFQSNLFILGITAITLFSVVLLCVPSWIHLSVDNQQLAEAEISFLQIRSLSFGAAIFTLSTQAVYLATGKTALVLYTSLIVAVCNIILDYFMVFGIGFFPEMGMEGAAYASTISEYVGAIFIFTSLIFSKLKTIFPLFKRLFLSIKQIKANLIIGIPLLFQGVVALSIWTVFFIWIEQMSDRDLTVSLNIRYIYFLAFIPIWGFAATTKTYIAQYFGAKKWDQIPLIQKRIQILSLISLFICFHGALFYPETLIRLVSTNASHIKDSAQILRIIGLSIFIYGFGSVYFQSISGLGKTRVTLLVECITTGIYLISAYCFIKVWKFPIQWVWMVEYIYYTIMLLTTFIYLRYIYRYE